MCNAWSATSKMWLGDYADPSHTMPPRGGHASERARLAAIGNPRPFVDGQLAAIARLGELVLDSENGRLWAFTGLSVEDWRAK